MYMIGSCFSWNPRMFISCSSPWHIFDKVKELFHLFISKPVKALNSTTIILIASKDFLVALVKSTTSSAYIRCDMDVAIQLTLFLCYFSFYEPS